MLLTFLIQVTAVFSVASIVCGEQDSHTSSGPAFIMGENKTGLEMNVNGSRTRNAKGRQLYKELVDTLLTDHSPVLPPNADDPSTTVNVSILMVLENLAYLDMKSQTLNIMAWFQIDWQDPALSWDTDLYPVDMIVVSEKKVWRPVLAIINTLLPRDQIMKIELPVSIFSDGYIRWFPGDSFIMTCHMNLNFYPFDTQTCIVSLSQWSHQSHHFNCTQAGIRATKSGNGEWDIVDLGYRYVLIREPGYDFWVLVYSITLQRKWMFYALNLLFPIFLVSVLNNVVFLLHVQSGDKMSVSVTSFLTLIVFLTMINGSLPENSDTVCYLSLYLAVQVTLGALAIVQSAIVVACHHRTSPTQDGRPPKSLERKLSSTFEQLVDDKLPAPHMVNKGDSEDWDKAARLLHSSSGAPSHKVLSGLCCDWLSREKKKAEKERAFWKAGRDVTDADVTTSSRQARDWSVMAVKIDSLCFPVFVGLNLLSLLIFCVVFLSA